MRRNLFLIVVLAIAMIVIGMVAWTYLSFGDEEEDRAPSSPTGLSADFDGTVVRLNWTIPEFNGYSLVGYHVYRSEKPGHYGDQPIIDIRVGNLSQIKCFDDQGLEPRTYYYVVKAYNDFGEGPASNEALVAVSVMD